MNVYAIFRKKLETNSTIQWLIPFKLVSRRDKLSKFSRSRYFFRFLESSKKAHLPRDTLFPFFLSPWSLAFPSALCFPTRYFKATFPFSRWIPSSRVSFPVCTLARSHWPSVGKQASRMQRFSSGHLETAHPPFKSRCKRFSSASPRLERTNERGEKTYLTLYPMLSRR